MRFVILGGGCYGSFYARQLLRARDAGVPGVGEIVVVDHDPEPRAKRELGERPGLRFETADWRAFLGGYLATLPDDATDQLVPPPFTPHLALAWILDRLRAAGTGRTWSLEPFRRFPGTPFEQQFEGGPLVVSHADWMCPVHCIEPARCPATRGPRYWDLDRTIREFTFALADGGQRLDGVHLFHCHHVIYGVGAYPAAEVPRAYASMVRHAGAADTGEPLRFLVGTISHCHGALHLLVGENGTLREAGHPPRPAAHP